MAVFKLASERVNAPASGRAGLRPVLLSGGAGLGVRAGQIPINAANVRFTPMPVPGIQPDPTAKAVLDVGSVWASEAFTFQEREDQARAQSAILAAEAEFRNLWYGTEKAEGFNTSAGQAAVDGFSNYNTATLEVMTGAMEGMKPSVKAKTAVALHDMRNKYLDRGANHKARQLGVWQQNIRQAEKEAVFRRILTDSDNPEVFGNYVAEHIGAIEEELSGQPEAVKVVKQNFLNETLSKTIDYHMGNKKYGLTAQYIDTATDIGVDPQIIAVKTRQLASAMAAQNRAAENNLIRQASTDKRKIAEQNALIFVKAVDKDDPSILDLILDPQARAKALTGFNTLRRGAVSDRNALMIMQRQRASLQAEPTRVWDDKFLPNISYEDRRTMFDTLLKDQRRGITSVLKQAEDWADVIVTPSQSTTNPTMVKAYKDRRYAIISTLHNAIRETEGSSQTAEAAMYATMNTILETSPKIAVSREVIQPIATLSSSEADLEVMDTLVERENFDALAEVIDSKYKAGAFDLREHYRGKYETVYEALALDPIARRQYSLDVQALNMRRRYYMDQAEKNNASGR